MHSFLIDKKRTKMKVSYIKMRYLLFILVLFGSNLQSQTIGLIDYQIDTEDGYVLFSPFLSNNTYLLDNCGRLVQQWNTDFKPAAEAILLDNGNLLRTSTMGPGANPTFAFGGGGERIQEIDWDMNVVWEFEYSDTTHRMHHDFSVMPNGNLLIPAWELKTEEEAIQAGRDPMLIPDGELWAEYIIEVDRTTSEIIWEWHLWDHLVQDFDDTKDNFGIISEHPELLDMNRTGGPTAEGGKNWLHINSIDFNPMMNQILINSFFISEFFIIDHSTTTEQASGHQGGLSTRGGDLLYRWGNPQNYDHGDAEDRTIYGSHKAHWIDIGLDDAAKIMYFNNGNGRPGGSASSIDIINPPVDDYTTGQYIYSPGVSFFPAVPEWSYSDENGEGFYSNFLSGAQRLTNGNTLICSGAEGRFFEITKQQEIVWDYISPVSDGNTNISQGDTAVVIGGRSENIVFRCTRYEEDFPGFEDKDLTPRDPLEVDFTEPYDCEIFTSTYDPSIFQIDIFPNPASEYVTLEIPSNQYQNIRIIKATGQTLETLFLKEKEQYRLDVSAYPSGIYYIESEGRIIGEMVIGN